MLATASRRQRAGVGARTALQRGSRARGVARRRGRDGSHRDRPGRDRPLPARRLAGPPGAARDGPTAAPAAATSPAPLRSSAASRSPARRRPRTAASAGCRGARTRPTTRARTRATACAPSCCPPCAGLHPAAEANVLRTLALLRDEAAVLDAAVDAALSDEQAALAALPPALARLCLQRLADDAAARRRRRRSPPGPASCSRSAAAPARAALDLGGGLRAVAEYGRLRFEPRPRSAGGGARAGAARVPGRAAFAGGELTCEVGDGARDRRRHARPRRARVPTSRSAPGAPATACARSGSAAAARCRTSSPTARCRASGARARPWSSPGGEIAWVPGVATGERFRVGERTRRTRAPGLACLRPTAPT